MNEFMTFASAMNDMPKTNRKIRCAHWAKGEYILCVLMTGYPIEDSLPCFYKKYNNGDISPWTPNQIEMFSNEWELHEA